MSSFKSFTFGFTLLLSIGLLSACSSWVYRINIPQGNFLEQSDVDKLRVNMSREQVIYVLGHSVTEDAFNNNKWYYVYTYNLDRDTQQRKELTVIFADDKLKTVEVNGYEQPKNFDIPLEQ